MSKLTNKRTNKRMKIEKPGVGRPLLGPAKNVLVAKNKSQKLVDLLLTIADKGSMGGLDPPKYYGHNL